MNWILGILTAYIMGSIPSAIWIGKTFYKTDVRQHGSKNAGATNTFRVLGKFPGTVVLLLDILKGFLAVSFVPRIFPVGIEFEGLYIVILSLIVIMGHMFSVFSKFKGGKGVATALGVIIALNPPTAGVVFAIFFVVFAISHYVSLGAIIASLSFPFVLRFLFGISDIYLNIFAIFIALAVILKHRQNIKRLINGNENKMFLVKKNK